MSPIAMLRWDGGNDLRSQNWPRETTRDRTGLAAHLQQRLEGCCGPILCSARPILPSINCRMPGQIGVTAAAAIR